VHRTDRASFFAGRPELARDGYIYVNQDIRGRYQSEGQFIMSQPLADHHDPRAPTPTTPWPGCWPMSRETMAARVLSAPAIQAFCP
jgi:predicted acyl esterase